MLQLLCIASSPHTTTTRTHYTWVHPSGNGKANQQITWQIPTRRTWKIEKYSLFAQTFGDLSDHGQAKQFVRYLKIPVLTEFYSRHENGLESGDECLDWLREYSWEATPI